MRCDWMRRTLVLTVWVYLKPVHDIIPRACSFRGVAVLWPRYAHILAGEPAAEQVPHDLEPLEEVQWLDFLAGTKFDRVGGGGRQRRLSAVTPIPVLVELAEGSLLFDIDRYS